MEKANVIQRMLYNTDEKVISEQWHGISNNVVCVTSKASDQTVYMRSLIRVFASHFYIL